MTEPAGAVLDQFQLSRVPVLPELLLKGLALQDEEADLGSGFEPGKLQMFVLDNPLLMLQLEQSSPRQLSDGIPTGAMLGEAADRQLFSLLQDRIRQYNPYLLRKQFGAFHYLHWRQSVLCKEITLGLCQHGSLTGQEELGVLGQLLNLGELILASVYGDEYLKLHSKTSSEQELCRLEQQAFGTGHAELGADFLQGLGLESFYCDALRYHHESIDSITDASLEVKLLWLANQLASKEGIDFDLIQAGQKLFGLEQESLRIIRQSAMEQVSAKLTALGISFSGARRLPLPEQALSSNRAAINNQIISAARGIGRFDSALLAANRPRQLAFMEVLRALADQSFGGAPALIFKKDDQTHKLILTGSTQPGRNRSEISLTLSETPSLVAGSFLSARPALIDRQSDGLKVADRQILSMLGASALICDPVVGAGQAQALIVFAGSRVAGEEYLGDKIQRQVLRRLWQEQDGHLSTAHTSNREFHYQQKIRETIHEVNNPLSIIKNYLQLLNLKQEQDSETQEEIKVIETEIERVKQILNRLSDNSETEDKESTLDINKIITSINKVFSASIPRDKALKVDLDLAPNLPFIQGKVNSLKQVLINLLKNAEEACSESGHIRVETRTNIMFDQTNYILINIRDDGPGMPEAVMQNLFQPGNTSKGGGHTGSGLAIVKNFMDELGGLISCQSDRHGTTFSLYLPRPADTPKPQGAERTDEATRAGSKSTNKVYDFKR